MKPNCKAGAVNRFPLPSPAPGLLVAGSGQSENTDHLGNAALKLQALCKHQTLCVGLLVICKPHCHHSFYCQLLFYWCNFLKTSATKLPVARCHHGNKTEVKVGKVQWLAHPCPTLYTQRACSLCLTCYLTIKHPSSHSFRDGQLYAVGSFFSNNIYIFFPAYINNNMQYRKFGKEIRKI